ncbi:hypothetical protein [Streptomyces sp. NPDC047990]|uniref:hypothetical protein n=1 Tax=Streptomyces sp. NPDC047990 TaxID=3365496 RepID=UPI003717988B
MEREVIPHPRGFVVEREYRGHGIYWVTLHGPNTYRFLKDAHYFIAAAARKWAGELDMSAGGWVSGGGGWNGTKGGGNCAHWGNCYAFQEK